MTRAVPTWLEPLRAASAGRGESGVEIVRGERPSLLDGAAVSAISAPFFAAFMIAAAIFRAKIVSAPLDPLGLLLRTAALAFTLRAVALGALWLKRVIRNREASEHRLVFSEHGLLWRAPEREHTIRRDELLAIEADHERGAAFFPQRARPVSLLLRGRRACTLPPYFGDAELLIARLTRKLGPAPIVPPSDSESASTSSSPSQRYERAARGQAEANDAVIPEGSGYLARGPYGSVLGAFMALDALRLDASDGHGSSLLLLTGMVALSLAVPSLWLARMRSRARSRLGIAMVLTPDSVLVRGTQGVIALRFADLVHSDVQTKQAWSPFLGAYRTHTLVLTTRDGSNMRFDEGFLGVPAAAVLAICAARMGGSPS